VDTPDQPVYLFDDRLPKLLIAQTGLLSSQARVVDHHEVFAAEQTEYQLPSGAEEIRVPLTWRSEEGLIVRKIYTFRRDSYLIDLDIQVINESNQPWTGRMYRQLQRTQEAEKSTFIYTYTGGVVSTPTNKYEKVDFDEMASWKPDESYTKGGWAAMIQHYFLGAWIPQQDQLNNFYSLVKDNTRYILGLQTTETEVPAGQSTAFSSQLYIGPKEHKRLVEIAPNLDLTVDYGYLTILAEPLFWLLNKIHSWVGNWGFAIIIVTLIIKLVFYKLSEAAYRSMANLRKFQPKMQAIRERYGNDRQRMSQAMMEIYKKEKINPLGGCLPMLVQIPVFIALYWVLLESVELRQADFILWIDDLSTKDPFYVLPVLMGISMFVQQKLNPAPMDPIQQKVLMALPWVFTLFFAFFPSGLVLYWVVNNILSITQQWYITRKIEAQGAKS
jgi:YidC/Oxa1 family membrane protein insertase